MDLADRFLCSTTRFLFQELIMTTQTTITDLVVNSTNNCYQITPEQLDL